MKQQANGCPSAAVACCLPSCAQGLSVQQNPEGHCEGLLCVVQVVICFILLASGSWWLACPAPLAREVVGHAQSAEVVPGSQSTLQDSVIGSTVSILKKQDP